MTALPGRLVLALAGVALALAPVSGPRGLGVAPAHAEYGCQRMWATAYFIRTMGPYTRGGTNVWQAGPTIAVAAGRWGELGKLHADVYWEGHFEQSFLVDDTGWLAWDQIDIAVDTWEEAYYWSGYRYVACFY